MTGHRHLSKAARVARGANPDAKPVDRIRRAARRGLAGPTEDDDLVALVADLRRAGRVCFDALALQPGQILAHHSPNELDVRHHGRRKAKGVLSGWPDLAFIDTPPRALEAKRERGGRVTPEQRVVLDAMAANGWETAVCDGLEAMRAQCRAWGYL